MTFAFVLTVLRRRWLAIVVSGLIGALLGLAVSSLIPTRYSATTSLVVSPLVTNPFTDARDDVNIRTEAEVLGSREVAERASEAMGIPLTGGSYLLTQVDVAAPSGSQILQVTVQAGSPQQAADAADALSQAYLDFRREGAEAIAQKYLATIDEQLAELRGQGSAAADALIAVLQQQRLSVMLSSPEPGRIIGAATVPTGPATPGLAVGLLAGAALGLLVGMAVALLQERTDRRVRAEDRLTAIVGGRVTVATSLSDADAWDEVAERVHVIVDSLPAGAAGGVLVDALGWPPEDEAGPSTYSLLPPMFDGDKLERSFAGGDDNSRLAGEVVDITGRTSRTALTRALRSCHTAVLLVSPQAFVADVRDELARLAEAGVQAIVIYVASPGEARRRQSLLRSGSDAERSPVASAPPESSALVPEFEASRGDSSDAHRELGNEAQLQAGASRDALPRAERDSEARA